MQGRLGRKRSAGVSCCEVSFQSVTIVLAAQIGGPLKFYPPLKKRAPIVSIGPEEQIGGALTCRMQALD